MGWGDWAIQSPHRQITRSPDSPEYECAVLRSESEAVAERRIDLAAAAAVGNDVQIAVGIRLPMVDGRRQHAAGERERGSGNPRRAARALGVADHRLHRRS